MTIGDIFEYLSSEWRLSGNTLSRGKRSYRLKNGKIYLSVNKCEEFFSFDLEAGTLDIELCITHYTERSNIEEDFDGFRRKYEPVHLDLHEFSVILEDAKQIIQAYKKQIPTECGECRHLLELRNYGKRGSYGTSYRCQVYEEAIYNGKRCERCQQLLKK